MVVNGINSALGAAVQGLRNANQDLGRIAQDVAENGADGLERNLADLITTRTAFKANAAVARAVSETTGRVLDILV